MERYRQPQFVPRENIRDVLGVPNGKQVEQDRDRQDEPPGAVRRRGWIQNNDGIAALVGDKLLKWGKTWKEIHVRRNKAVLKVQKALAGIRMG